MPARIFFGLAMIATTLGAPRNVSGASFDVISVKPSPRHGGERFESYCEGGGRFITRGPPLLWAIKWAYGLYDYQVIDGWPAWLNAFETYDIEAESDGRLGEDECRQMVRALFAERFKLRLRHENRTVPAFALVVARNNPKLFAAEKVIINGEVKQSTSEREAPGGWTMARLANYLASVRGIERPVVNGTSLNGAYGFTLTYSAREGDGRPDIFTAVREELGLRLRATRAPIEMWAVWKDQSRTEGACGFQTLPAARFAAIFFSTAASRRECTSSGIE